MKPTLLCLHGWGGSKASFDPLRDALAGTDLAILTPDLPGFGAEPDPARPWTVDDYAAWVRDWTLKNKHVDGPLWILGHSHGGRTAIVIAAKRVLPVERLFLCAPAINRKRRYHLRRAVGTALAKTGKFFLAIPGLSLLAPFARRLLYTLLRVHDYERASPLMRQTLVLVTKDDLAPLFPSVTQPVDLFWGDQDRQTPVGDGEYMHALLPRCEFHVYAGTRHGVHKTNAREIAAVIGRRLGLGS
jgi:pimeloyl-ACP methyl ester carboxylesterase